MKLEKFIDKLYSLGFIQMQASNWYENNVNDTSIMVGIMANEIDCLGHIPIEVNTFNNETEEENEKDYMTTKGAWNAIKKLF